LHREVGRVRFARVKRDDERADARDRPLRLPLQQFSSARVEFAHAFIAIFASVAISMVSKMA